MGKEMKEDIVEQMQNTLGLEDEETQDENIVEEIDPESGEDDAKESDPKVEDQKEDNAQADAIAKEKQSVDKEIIKLDVKIEELSSASVDMEEFYQNLETHLSDEEQELEFSDKPAYMKLIAQKAREYESSNSNQEKLNELIAQKEELERTQERQSAILEVSQKFPDYNHEEILTYFNDKLSKEEQQKIYDASSSYSDVYENTYKKYRESNPANITSKKAPDIPNVNNVRRTTANNADVDDGFTSSDEKLQAALGL